MPTTPLAIDLPSPWGAFRTTLDVPDGDVPPVALVPALRALADAIVAHVHAAVRPQVSCRAGCGACCRQMVPLDEPEMHALAALVAAMPADRRRAVESRFEETRRALERAGLLSRLLAPPPGGTEYTTLVLDYLRAGIPCPFLEDESCSIHADRPAICREYSVTTPAAHCAAPFENQVRVVPIPVYVGSIVAIAIDETTGLRTKITPLTLAPDWVAAHPDRLGLLPARRIMERAVEILGESFATIRAAAGG